MQHKMWRDTFVSLNCFILQFLNCNRLFSFSSSSSSFFSSVWCFTSINLYDGRFIFFFSFHSCAQWLFALFHSFLFRGGLKIMPLRKYITLRSEWRVKSAPNEQMSICAQKLFNYLILIVSKLPLTAQCTPLCGYLMVKWEDIGEM